MPAAILNYDEISIGDLFSFKRTLTAEDVSRFAELTGDFSPLHVDEDFGRQSQFGKNLVHGMLAGSLFSTLVGMYCAGQKSLYFGQTLRFRRPIFFNTPLVVSGKVIKKYDSIRLITLATEIIMDDGVVAIDGEAQVKVI